MLSTLLLVTVGPNSGDDIIIMTTKDCLYNKYKVEVRQSRGAAPQAQKTPVGKQRATVWLLKCIHKTKLEQIFENNPAVPNFAMMTVITKA